jgi:hypothetical protein
MSNGTVKPRMAGPAPTAKPAVQTRTAAPTPTPATTDFR